MRQMNYIKSIESSNVSYKLDIHDEKILSILSGDGRISISELSRRINLSKTPTQVRVKRLESEGFILGYRAILNPIQMGQDHVAFVEVTLNDTREDALTAFNKAIISTREIEQVHMIAGNFDYLLKVRTQSMPAYRKVLAEKVSALPHVANTKTFVAMQSVKEGNL